MKQTVNVKALPTFLRQNYLLVLTAFYTALIVIAPFTAFKVIDPNLWGITFAAGLLSTLLSFQLLDVANELDGKAAARRMVYAGFIVKWFLYLAWIPMIIALPAKDPVQAALFADVFHVAIRVFIATEIIAVTMHLILDIPLFGWLKEKLPAPFFVRSAITNFISWTIAAVMFVTIAFWGTPRFSMEMMVGHILVRYPIMLVYTLITSSFVRFLRKA